MWRLSLNRDPELDLTPVTVNGKSYYVDAIFTEGRTASAALRNERIVIRIPKFTRASEAQRLFINLKGRIARMMEMHPERFPKQALVFRHGQVLSLCGAHLTLVVEDSPAGRASARVYDDKILVRIPVNIAAKSRDLVVTKLVIRSLCRNFAPLIESRVNALNKKYFDAEVCRVTVKNIKSRWGSYSYRSKSISISLRLLFAPEAILDYVIVHELSHAIVHNHGRRFWSHVGKILPDYRSCIRWLRLNGDMLGIAEAANANTFQQLVTSSGSS